MQQPKITIKPKAKSNALFISLSSVCMLLLILVLSQFYWQQAKFTLMLLLLLSLSVLFLGVLKLLEPKTSFIISPQSITFIHRKGRWQLSWDNIKAFHPITNTHGVLQEQLCYIGITLHSLDPLRECISLRLANHLIHEQKPLITYCLSRRLMPLADGIINFDRYICEDGQVLKGPLAGFFHQCQALKKATGAHLFINDSSIDRELAQFALLLKQCQSAAKNYQQPQ